MRTCKTQGIVINKRSLGEKDYVITFFTPLYGKIDCFAKGAKRIESKFTGHLDLLLVCDVEIYNSPKNSILTECQLHNSYSHFRKNLDKFYISEQIAKTINDYTTENENSEDIYALLLDTFDALCINEKESLIFEAFKVKLFGLLGHIPDLHNFDNTDFSDLDLRLKKLINFLLIKPYKEIIKVYLDKKDALSLKQMTSRFIEYSI